VVSPIRITPALGGDATPLSLARFDQRFLELGLDESAPCLGDSGGPAFVDLADGTEALAGIVSYTDALRPFLARHSASAVHLVLGVGDCRE
jgi:hypothetical protein